MGVTHHSTILLHMRLIKQIIIGFIGIGTIIFMLSFFLPSRIHVSKSILLRIPKDSVVHSLTQITQWHNWNPLLQDSSAAYNFLGENKVTWKTHNNKTNSVELIQPATDSIIAVIKTDGVQAFESGFNVTDNTDNTGQTKVDWWIMEDLEWYPWEKFYGLFSESLKESYLENSMQSFKRYMENSN